MDILISLNPAETQRVQDAFKDIHGLEEVPTEAQVVAYVEEWLDQVIYAAEKGPAEKAARSSIPKLRGGPRGAGRPA